MSAALRDDATTTPRVWVGCLGCYNAGHLVGEWFDATDAPTEMAEWVAAVDYDRCTVCHRRDHCPGDGNAGHAYKARVPFSHKRDGHDELWVFDHDGFGGAVEGEFSPVEAREWAEALTTVSDRDAFLAYVRDVTGDWASAVDDFEEAFCGEWDRPEDYAQELADDGSGSSSAVENRWPFTCIDWSQAWRELTFDGYSASDTGRGTVYIFRSI